MKNDDVIRSMICLFAMDGEVSKQEIQFLQEMRKKLGVSQEVVQSTFDLAKQGQGKVHLSDDPAEMRRMFEILVRAAVADGKIDPQERKVLDAVAAKTGISRKKIEDYIKNKLKQALVAKPKPTGSKLRQPQTMNCPKCGFKQKAGRVDCIRCGIIFKRLEQQQQEVTSEPDPEESAPNAPLPQAHISWLHKTPASEQKVAQRQQAIQEQAVNVNKTLAIIGAIVVLLIAFGVCLYSMAGILTYSRDSREKKALSDSESATVITTKAKIVSGNCDVKTSRRRTSSRMKYRCFVEYSFEAVLNDGSQNTFTKKKEYVENGWYQQRRGGEMIPIYYLTDDPEVSRTMARKYLGGSDLLYLLVLLLASIVGIGGGAWMLLKNIRKEHSAFDKSEPIIKVRIHNQRNRFF